MAEPVPPSDRRPTADPDGVSLAVAAVGGVASVAWFGPWPAWLVAAAGVVALPAMCCAGRRKAGGTRLGNVRGAATAPGAGIGVAVLLGLVVVGALAAGARASMNSHGSVVSLVGRTGVAHFEGRVAEEPQVVAFGGRRTILEVRRVEALGARWSTRERVSVILPARLGPVAVGDRLALDAGMERDPRADRLGWQPLVRLRRPVVTWHRPVGSPLLAVTERLRAGARVVEARSLPPDQAGLLAGMALGDTTLLPGDLEAAFRSAGLTHLVAVSGANVAVVLVAGLSVAAAAGARTSLLALVGGALVLAFVVLTRWEPSVLRAGVMAALALVGVATGRGPGARRALSLAVLALVLLDPGLVGSLGFILSVAATAGVLWAGPIFTAALPGILPPAARKALGVTLGAQAGALPVLAWSLGQVAVAGLPANLVALPLAAPPMLLGVVVALVAPFSPVVASLACHLAAPFLAALALVARRAAHLPHGVLAVSGPARAVPCVVALATVVLARRRVARMNRAPPLMPR